MRDLIVSNHALGDREALDKIWAEHGYWFFKNVLDEESLAWLRNEYVSELKALDLVELKGNEPMWNGGDLSGYPATFRSLHDRHVWQQFVKLPKIKAFFEDVMGDELYWIPVDYYRLVAPSPGDTGKAYLGTHQDGMGNPGIDFVTCWMPLHDIDDKVGGLVLATNDHERGYMEIIDGQAVFRDGPPIGSDSWARGDYQAGDVVIFKPSMPHYGQGNSSDRFRLSLDIRPVRMSSTLPVVGTVKSITPDHVVIASDRGADESLPIDDATQVRGPGSPNSVPITRHEAPEKLPVGTAVMATRDGDRTLVLRPQM